MDSPSTPLAPDDFRQHAEHLRALARRLVRDESEADDLVQETWLSVLARKPTAAPERGWRPWLAGTLKNLAREKRRGEGRRAYRERAVARGEAALGEDVVERLETFQLLAQELAALDEPYRSALYQRFFENRSNAEIAAREGIVEATVRSRHMRGLEMLRERLDRKHHGDRSAWCALLARIGEVEPAEAVAGSKVFLVGLVLLLVGLGTWTIVALQRSPPEVARAPVARTENASELPAEPPSASSGAQPAAVAATAENKAAAITTPVRKGKPVLHIVDERTGEPLPDYGVLVWPKTVEKLALISDEHGRIECPFEIEAGEIAVELVDEPMMAEQRRKLPGRHFPYAIPVQFRPGSGPIELAVAVGPTFRLDLRGPERAIEAMLGEAARVTLSGSDPGGTIPSTATRLRRPRRPADMPWVRFNAEAWALSGSPPHRLRVGRSFWSGEALVAIERSIQSSPVVIELTPRAALSVVVYGEGADQLDADGDLTRDGRVIERATGILNFDPEPGTYRLHSRSIGWTDDEREITLAPDKIEKISVQLRPLLGSTHVRGRIKGLGESMAAQVFLRDPETGLEISTRAHVERGDVLFAFDHVPPHACELRADCPDSWRWSESRVVVHPPVDDVVLVADTSKPVRRGLKFRAFDGETGARVDIFSVDLRVDPPGGIVRRQRTNFGNTIFGGMPIDAELAWTVIAEGYLPVRGDARSIEPEDDHEVVRVNLVHGWQRDVVVREAKTSQPLEGAHVLADGIEVGRTDASGTLRVTRAAAPSRVDVKLDGWRIAPGGSSGIDPASCRYTSEEALRIVAELERVP